MPPAPQITVKVEGAEDNRVKIRGALREVNLAHKTCRVYTSDSEYITCHFSQELELDVIYALGRDVEVAGSVVKVSSNGNGFGVEEIGLQSITELAEYPPAAGGKRLLTGKDLLESGLVGMWEGRGEDEDDVEFARRLRREASVGGKDLTLLVIDTNVLVGVLRRKPPALKWLNSATNETFIVPGFVVMELVAGCENAQELADVDELMKKFTVYWPNEKGVARALGYFRSYYRSHGLGLVDALIAACAVNLHIPVCTNDQGFRAIPRLKVISPYAPSRK